MIFGKGSVPVKIAAEIYGKNPEWIRRGIVEGWLPIGIATRPKYGKRTNFYISPMKLYHETGYIWRGDDK